MEAEESSRTKLQNLPFDCLYHIFGYLSLFDKIHFSRVCSEWIDLHSSIWRISEFALISENVDCLIYENENEETLTSCTLTLQEFQEVMMTLGPLLKKFYIGLDDSPLFLEKVVHLFGGTAYKVDGILRYGALLDMVIQYCHNLKQLEIRVPRDCEDLSEKFDALFVANQELADLKLYVGDHVDLNKVMSLKDASGPVKNVYLTFQDSCLQLGQDKLFNAGVPRGSVDNFCKLLKLRNVNLKELRLFRAKIQDMVELMPVIANHAKELQVLWISFGFGPIDTDIFLVLEKLSVMENLEDLSIQLAGTNIRDEDCSAIASNCRKLKKVKLEGIFPVFPREGLQILMTALPDLVSFTLMYSGVHSIAQRDLQYNLRSLEINECNMISRGTLKDISLLTNLEELSLIKCNFESVNDNVITEITIGCRKLKNVTIDACPDITGNGINTLMTAIPNLESVVLKDLDVKSIVRSNAQSSLQRLKLIKCSEVAQCELEKIAVFKNLKEFYFVDINLPTSHTFVVIGSACKQLTKVTLDSVYHMTDEKINAIVSTLPNLVCLELRDLKYSFISEDFQPPNVRNFRMLVVPEYQSRVKTPMEEQVSRVRYLSSLIYCRRNPW